MPKMKAVQVSKPDGPFEVVERDVRDPGPGEIRVREDWPWCCVDQAILELIAVFPVKAPPEHFASE
jgi:Zn-dependent alcohol dehydrogenase